MKLFYSITLLRVYIILLTFYFFPKQITLDVYYKTDALHHAQSTERIIGLKFDFRFVVKVKAENKTRRTV